MSNSSCCCWCCCCCCCCCCCTAVAARQSTTWSQPAAASAVFAATSIIMCLDGSRGWKLQTAGKYLCMEPTNRRNLNTIAWNLQLLLHRNSIQHQYSSVADVPAPVRALAASNTRSSRSNRSSSAHCISTVYVELIWATCDNICGIQSQTSQSPCEIILDVQPQPGLMDSQIKCLERVCLLLARLHCACHRWSRSIRAQGN